MPCADRLRRRTEPSRAQGSPPALRRESATPQWSCSDELELQGDLASDAAALQRRDPNHDVVRAGLQLGRQLEVDDATATVAETLTGAYRAARPATK
jgi:hypothetical protein